MGDELQFDDGTNALEVRSSRKCFTCFGVMVAVLEMRRLAQGEADLGEAPDCVLCDLGMLGCLKNVGTE